METFNEVRQLLLDPSLVQEREELVQTAECVKIVSTRGMVASGALILVSWSIYCCQSHSGKPWDDFWNNGSISG